MKRKVIQIADSTQLVSLPRKWAVEHGIKKGDEVEVKEEENKLTITTGRGPQFNEIEIDITELDRTSILYCIDGLYRLGYDDIKIIFERQTVKYIRTGEEIRIIPLLHYIISRLPGFEIVQQRDKFCLIKDIQEVSGKEFETVIKRIFLLLLNAFEDVIEGIKSKNSITLENIKEKHDTLTKFISYSLRLINKVGYSDAKKNHVLYHVLASIDKVGDILKFTSRDVLASKISFEKESIEILEIVFSSFKVYSELFYKFNVQKIHEISENKEKVIKKIGSLTKAKRQEIIFLNDIKSSMEILTDLTEAAWALKY